MLKRLTSCDRSEGIKAQSRDMTTVSIKTKFNQTDESKAAAVQIERDSELY